MPQLVRAALGLGPLARPAGRADEPWRLRVLSRLEPLP